MKSTDAVPDEQCGLVSVVIPTRNRKNLVCDAIDSALGQTYPGVEVVVVDDGSDDGTAGLLEDRYGGRVRVVEHRRGRGAAAARNTGIRAARGAWVRGLDSDDVMAPTAVQEFVDAAARFGDAGNRLFFSDCWHVEAGTGRRYPLLSSVYNGFEPAEAVVRATWGSGLFFAARPIFERHGYFREDFERLEDLEWLLRLLVCRGVGFHTVNRLLLEYRFHPGNAPAGDGIAAAAEAAAYARCRERAIEAVGKEAGMEAAARVEREYAREEAENGRGGIHLARRKLWALACKRLTPLYLAYHGVSDGFAR